jgi:hypothetical protein
MIRVTTKYNCKHVVSTIIVCLLPIIHEYWKYAACISIASYYDKHSHKCRYCATQQNKNWLQTNNENYDVIKLSNYLTYDAIYNTRIVRCYLPWSLYDHCSDRPRFGQKIRSLRRVRKQTPSWRQADTPPLRCCWTVYSRLAWLCARNCRLPAWCIFRWRG